jgi:hypothetical protein
MGYATIFEYKCRDNMKNKKKFHKNYEIKKKIGLFWEYIQNKI